MQVEIPKGKEKSFFAGYRDTKRKMENPGSSDLGDEFYKAYYDFTQMGWFKRTFMPAYVKGQIAAYAVHEIEGTLGTGFFDSDTSLSRLESMGLLNSGKYVPNLLNRIKRFYVDQIKLFGKSAEATEDFWLKRSDESSMSGLREYMQKFDAEMRKRGIKAGGKTNVMSAKDLKRRGLSDDEIKAIKTSGPERVRYEFSQWDQQRAHYEEAKKKGDKRVVLFYEPVYG